MFLCLICAHRTEGQEICQWNHHADLPVAIGFFKFKWMKSWTSRRRKGTLPACESFSRKSNARNSEDGLESFPRVCDLLGPTNSHAAISKAWTPPRRRQNKTFKNPMRRLWRLRPSREPDRSTQLGLDRSALYFLPPFSERGYLSGS